MRDNDKQLLSAWLQSHDVENSAEKLKKLETFHDFLYEWSGKINLVSSNDRELLVENHIIDSLSPIDILNNPATIIDIGSGGGFPAIPLGIICPHLNIVMVESREKKAKFLSVAIDFVDLPNLSVSRCRIEEYKPKTKFDYATVRAVTLTPKINRAIFKTLKPGGVVIYYEKRGKCRILKAEK